MGRLLAAAVAACLVVATAARAECPGNTDALGVVRTIAVDPAEHGRIGTMQYHETLPLEDKEVVLTFDDGPLPPHTSHVLEILASQCVKATFFIVGKQARAFPDLVRRAYDEGHTIATHSENHPHAFHRLSPARIAEEVDGGIAATAAALGETRGVAPFFRVPGLRTSAATESYLAEHDLMVWSADFPADDWRHISAKQVLQRALDRLEKKGKGVLLLHDIHRNTVQALPDLLRELKVRGYRIVHVVPAGPDRPKTVTAPEQWVLHHPAKPAWPSIVEAAGRESAELRATAPQLPVPSPQSFGWPNLFQAKPLVATRLIRMKLVHGRGYQLVPVVPPPAWPAPPAARRTSDTGVELPVPSPRSFGIPHPFGPHLVLPSGMAATPSEVSELPDARVAPLAAQGQVSAPHQN